MCATSRPARHESSQPGEAPAPIPAAGGSSPSPHGPYLLLVVPTRVPGKPLSRSGPTACFWVQLSCSKDEESKDGLPEQGDRG